MLDLINTSGVNITVTCVCVARPDREKIANRVQKMLSIVTSNPYMYIEISLFVALYTRYVDTGYVRLGESKC